MSDLDFMMAALVIVSVVALFAICVAVKNKKPDFNYDKETPKGEWV